MLTPKQVAEEVKKYTQPIDHSSEFTTLFAQDGSAYFFSDLVGCWLPCLEGTSPNIEMEEWIIENKIEMLTEEGQTAFKLRWT